MVDEDYFFGGVNCILDAVSRASQKDFWNLNI
jgi:hypothetical protein